MWSTSTTNTHHSCRGKQDRALFPIAYFCNPTDTILALEKANGLILIYLYVTLDQSIRIFEVLNTQPQVYCEVPGDLMKRPGETTTSKWAFLSFEGFNIGVLGTDV